MLNKVVKMDNPATPHVLIRRLVFPLLLACSFVNSKVTLDTVTVIAKTTTMVWSSIDIQSRHKERGKIYCAPASKF